jgi:hypothetical protein
MQYRYPHTRIYHSTVHNKKAIKSAQRFINWRMDKENMVNIHNWVLFSHKEKFSNITCRKIDGNGDHRVDQDKPSSKRQVNIACFQLYVVFRPTNIIMMIQQVIKGGLFGGEARKLRKINKGDKCYKIRYMHIWKYHKQKALNN